MSTTTTPKINFTFSLDEINIILTGLGELAAKASSGLILEIKKEVEPKIKKDGDKIDPKQELELSFTVDEANVILAGLGELPARVSTQLIVKIQEVAKTQIGESTPVDVEVKASTKAKK
jgi:hypothetical protein